MSLILDNDIALYTWLRDSALARVRAAAKKDKPGLQKLVDAYQRVIDSLENAQEILRTTA